jgi:hypothetical protein
MGQSKADPAIQVLLAVLLGAFPSLDDAPASSLTALAERFGVSQAGQTSPEHTIT